MTLEQNRHVWRVSECGFVCEICGEWHPRIFQQHLPEFGCIDTLPHNKGVSAELPLDETGVTFKRAFLNWSEA
jgi:hypothetical protein